MKVQEALSFEEYFNDSRFEGRCDNIYHRDRNGEWVQSPTAPFHTEPESKNHDLSVNRILISADFVYFGSNKLKVDDFPEFVPRGRGHRVQDGSNVEAFATWVRGQGWGVQGNPHLPFMQSGNQLVGIGIRTFPADRSAGKV